MYINKDANVTKHNTFNNKSVSIAGNLDIVFARKLDITANCAASKKMQTFCGGRESKVTSW